METIRAYSIGIQKSIIMEVIFSNKIEHITYLKSPMSK